MSFPLSFTLPTPSSLLDQVSQAAEERQNAVKAAIQEALDDNAQKKKGAPQQEQALVEGPDDILVGWTMLGKGRERKERRL
jgi:hypothetical protein